MAKYTKAKCHPDRKHAGGGLCMTCYMRRRRQLGAVASPIARCHPDRPAHAYGFCKACYNYRNLGKHLPDIDVPPRFEGVKHSKHFFTAADNKAMEECWKRRKVVEFQWRWHGTKEEAA